MEQKYLTELKNRMHVNFNEDDENLMAQLEIAHAKISSWCGEFSMDDLVGRNLVYEYVRFIYNGKTELFYDRFKTDLSNFGFDLVGDEDGD